jgi:hypothetical protein
MPYIKKKYKNGRSRNVGDGIPASSTRKPKDYLKVAVGFHGGEMAYNQYVENGRNGYGK